MILRAGRYTKLLSILFFAVAIIAVIAIVSLPSSVTAKPSTLASGEAAISVIVEAEQAALAGPVSVGTSIGGAGYVQFGSTAPASVFQPTAPYYATFYYPWYGAPTPDGHWSYWSGQGNQPPNTWFSHYLPDPLPSEFDPSRELYSSHDTNLLYWQFGKMAEAKMEVAISSWWGQGDRTDDNFGFILKDAMKRSENPYPNLRWALYYEEESNSDPSVAQIVSDLDYIADQYAAEPGYLKIGGKPVIFVYSAGGDGVETAKRWNEAKALAKLPFYVVLKLFSGYKTISPQPDSWHQYGPATRASNQSPYSFSVSPGFWYDSGGEAPRLGRDLAEFRTAVSQMVASNAAWKLVTTWNEWGEGTAVEPGEQVVFESSTGRDILDAAGAPFKNAYVDALRELLPPLEAGTGRAAAAEAREAAGGVAPTAVATAAPGTFSFAVAGDLGGGSAATASLDALAGASADFFLGIGDMSYDEVKPESAWCSYVQQHVGPTYPFELLVGNHEEQPSGPNGFIDNFAACLPDRLGVQGLYAHQYYFDYPPDAPLARFILIDPDLYRGATVAEYCTGGETENCDWLKARIDEAQSQGLWTIVGMHKNCLTIGEKSCEIGAELLNELIAAKVDLVLQGHDHGYQRSKQLGLGAGCAAVKTRAFNPACVVDDGSDGSYLRGAGLVFAISGAFGRSAYTMNPSDPEAGYMATWMDAAERSNGFLQFTVTKDRIDGQFVAARGSFSDHLTIAETDVTPAVTPTPGGTVPPPPCPAPPDHMGVATLNVDFPVAGSYYVWSLMLAANAAQRAFWVQIDDTCATRVVGGGTGAAAWKWINYQDGEPDSPIQEPIAGGAHTVRLYGIDAGVKVDKLLFTTDPNPVLPEVPPAGTGDHLFLPLVSS